jgi:predicted DNA-binding protein with PD1-like motif
MIKLSYSVYGVLIVVSAIASWHLQAELLAAGNDDAGVSWSDARLWVLRLRPGDDLVESIQEFSRRNSIDAGAIVTCVGSLRRARLRFANQKEYEDLGSKGRHFEIVALGGTFSTKDHHLHLAVANEQGQAFGGHADRGNQVYTTAEIVIVEGVDWAFRRELDADTTYRELSPIRRSE